MIIMKNNIFNDSIENNTQKTNGDGHMKYYIDIMDKKAWKKLSKSHAYGEYAKLGLKLIEAKELAEEAKAELLANRDNILKFKEELEEHDKHIEQLNNELKELGEEMAYKLKVKQLALDHVKEERDQYKERCEELELQNAESTGKADASLDLISEIQKDLEDLREEVVEARGTAKRLTSRMTGKRARANINTGTIRHYNNIIRKCKKDIEQGKDVDGNRATIVELRAAIRNLQRQVDAANGTFNEMKRNKTVVAQRIVKMDAELDKRYKLQNLLGELGYI